MDNAHPSIKASTAISIARRISKKIDRQPTLVREIIELYRAGTTQALIAEAVIPEHVEINAGIARNAIRNVLIKHLSLDERERLTRDHQRDSSLRVGYRTLREKKGIHAQTPAELSRLGAETYPKGLGKISTERRQEIARKVGERCVVEKMGIFSLTPEQRSEISRRTIAKVSPEERLKRVHHMLEKEGKSPMSDAEKNKLLECIQKPEFQVQTGSHKGRPHYKNYKQRCKRPLGQEEQSVRCVQPCTV